MYKIIELNRKQIFQVFSSMTAVKQAIQPERIYEIDINFESSRDAFEVLEKNIKAMEENPGILKPTILNLVLYEIDPATLPVIVTQEVLNQIPSFLINL
jgi:hypothetical protein